MSGERKALETVGEQGLTLHTLDDMMRFADMVIAAGVAPRSMSSKPQVVVALQMGLELGVSPMQALQNIAVINGMPSVYGDLGVALVRGSGLVEDVQEELVGEGDELTAVCRIKRKGNPSWIVGTFSIGDAKRAKLYGKKGPWTEYPRRMLMWRARSWAYRDGFADVLRGLRFTEEVRDIPVEPRETEYERRDSVPSVDDILAPPVSIETPGVTETLEGEDPDPDPEPATEAAPPSQEQIDFWSKAGKQQPEPEDTATL